MAPEPCSVQYALVASIVTICDRRRGRCEDEGRPKWDSDRARGQQAKRLDDLRGDAWHVAVRRDDVVDDRSAEPASQRAPVDDPRRRAGPGELIDDAAELPPAEHRVDDDVELARSPPAADGVPVDQRLGAVGERERDAVHPLRRAPAVGDRDVGEPVANGRHHGTAARITRCR